MYIKLNLKEKDILKERINLNFINQEYKKKTKIN